MKLQMRWAEVAFGDSVDRYIMKIDSDNIGFDQTSRAFMVEGKDGSITSYWNCPVKMYQEAVNDDNYVDFDKGWEK